MLRTPKLLALSVAALAVGCSDNARENNGGPGVSYPDAYIRGDQKTRLVFEVDAVDGFAPRDEAKEYVLEKVGDVVDKPDGIEFVTDGTIESRGADYVWTYEALQEVAKETIDYEIDDNTARIHVLYLDGTYENEDGTTLGVAWKNQHLAIFQDVINDSCERPLLMDRLCGPAESSILLHEVGHVIGLVDNGVPMVEDHKDEDKGAHDNNDECVMYWAYEGTQIFDLLAERLTGQDTELDFDEACKNDLAAIRDQ